jgi:hemerythrin-like domain-containing protein
MGRCSLSLGAYSLQNHDSKYIALCEIKVSWLTSVPDSHSYVWCASEMANAHNVIIRGLNAILQQAPHVPVVNAPNYNAKDVKDLLFYVQAWVKMVNHHHSVEEDHMFPGIEKFSGRVGIMEEPLHQHELFHPGMERLLAYATTTKPEEYRWAGPGGMEEIIDSFSKYLTDHLYAEINVFLGMKDLDSEGLKKAWMAAEKVAQANGNIGMLVSLMSPFVPPLHNPQLTGNN